MAAEGFERWPEASDFISELLEERDRGSDRALVLVAASMLDILIGRLLLDFFVEDTPEKDLMEGTAPLAAFSARIRVALALGLITKAEAKALHTIRDIRNSMAHRLGVKLSDTSLVDKIAHVHTQMFKISTNPENTSRETFVVVASALLAGLIAHINNLQRRTHSASGYGT